MSGLEAFGFTVLVLLAVVAVIGLVFTGIHIFSILPYDIEKSNSEITYLKSAINIHLERINNLEKALLKGKKKS